MYLKSLVLKGFKSFADRSVLTMEPGITAIVGPNGSGKSNISDAVLWVLGERNAKHLRGASMEDVIFAGSSARKATGLAEVDLVLDNSDGKLPVEFDEVAITRRMYRSGESEYLINGTVARRMDVLNILHDSGLGTGTHSIISQGSLDSILQSKPEDRRSLIEEAAGVLKHKQRKVKAERKLANMDATLARVRDVSGEVARQLGPLERKAKKARAHQELSEELSAISLSLAVDDLRQLRSAWDSACAKENELVADLAVKHQAISEAEAAAEQLQEQIRRQAADAGELSRSYQRASNAVERFDGAVLLLHEKRRSAQNAEAEVRLSLESGAAKRASAVEERLSAQLQLDQASSEEVAAKEKVAGLDQERRANAERRRGAEDELESLQKQGRVDEREQERLRRELSENQEALANGLAHARIVEARVKELELSLSRAEQEAQKLTDAAGAAAQALDDVQARESAARAGVAEAMSARGAAREQLDQARRELTVLESKIEALQELERDGGGEGPARGWVVSHAEEMGVALEPLSHAVRASEGFEELVEHLLGVDVAALAVANSSDARGLVRALREAGESGRAVLLPTADMEAPAIARQAADKCAGRALIDELSYADNVAGAVACLLGDVVVCDSLSAALDGQASDTFGARFVTMTGDIVWRSGKITVGGADAHAGVLARARQLDELCASREGLKSAFADAQGEEQRCETLLRQAQAESLKLSEQLAQAKGAKQAADAEARRAADALASARRDFADMERQRAQAADTVAKARPNVEALQAKLDELAQEGVRRSARIEELQDAVVPLRKEAAQLRDALSEAKLAAATLRERVGYASRIVEARTRDVENLDASREQLRAQLARKLVAQQRVEPLLALFEELTTSARSRARLLEERATVAQTSSDGLHSQVSAAREAARTAHDAYDATNAALSAARVEKGRLEVQVDTAVNVIVGDLSCPLDHALELPELEDRAKAEDDAFKLKRRITNMGAINPDAAQEYEQLKSRYDYLASQLADLDGARASLAKIVRVIDARMKEDFEKTFAEVDENFRTIFATLFPGGSAELILTDPDDVENTGVEVNAQPRGKRITKMMLMSGGEKSLTALALLFAVYRIRSAPFYILDEVEAALDDSNLRRLLAYLQSIRNDTQLIMVTHQRRTMEMSDVLFGVSMQADGVTHVISQKLDNALRYAE